MGQEEQRPMGREVGVSSWGEGSGGIRFGGGWSGGRISSHRAEIHVPAGNPDGEGQMESAVRILPRLMSGRDRHVRAISCAGSILLGPFVGPAPHWAWLGPLQAREGAEILPCPLQAGVRCPTPALDGMPCGHQ